MKMILFFLIAIATAVFGAAACGRASNSRPERPALKAPLPSRAQESPSRLLLADRSEQKDSIVYGTDPEMDRQAEEEERQEKIKEERSWRMLEHMYLFQNTPTVPVPPATPGSTKQ